MLLCYVIDSGLSTSLLLLATLIIMFYITFTFTLHYITSQLSVLHLAVEPFTACDGARYWLRNGIFAYCTCVDVPIRKPRRNTAIMFGVEKIE